MKSKINTLNFKKLTVNELNEKALKGVVGGTSLPTPVRTENCTFCINSSNGPGGGYLNEEIRQL